MKDRFRIWGLYFGLILSFVLHYFATSQLKIYENHLWELFDSPKATIIMYLENGLHAIYYVVAFLLMLFLCNTKNFKIIEELIFLALPALFITCNRQYYDKSIPLGVYEFVILYSIRTQCLLSVFLYRYMHMKLGGNKQFYFPLILYYSLISIAFSTN